MAPRPIESSHRLLSNLRRTTTRSEPEADGTEPYHLPLRAGSRSRDGGPSGGETELQNGERIGTAGVERLEVGEPGVGLGLVNVV
jgi:hypothetical protein